MTRETKIGLLVGLAFIIVIGILLSDYNRNESQAAPLTAVASDVQKGATTPHNGSTETVILPPVQPPPARPVLTREEVQQQQHPPQPPHREPIPAAGNERQADPHPPVTPVPPTDPNRHGNPGNPPSGLDRVVRENPGEFTSPDQPTTDTPAQDPPPATPTVNGARAYVAIAGDTVSKLAGRFLGANTKANRDAIVAINPTLKANPNNVVVGRTYMIPKSGAAPVAAPPRMIAGGPTPAPANNQHYYYTVKENDSLWRIASEQLGDAGAVTALKELNQDVLKGSDTLHPNMRLRLPAKPVASVN